MWPSFQQLLLRTGGTCRPLSSLCSLGAHTHFGPCPASQTAVPGCRRSSGVSLLCFSMRWVEVAAVGLVGVGAARPALEKASHGLTNLRLTLMFHHSQVRQSSRCPSLGQLPNPLPCALCLTQCTCPTSEELGDNKEAAPWLCFYGGVACGTHPNILILPCVLPSRNDRKIWDGKVL